MNLVVVILCLIVLYPLYSHLPYWHKATVLPLRSFGLSENEDDKLVIKSYLSTPDAEASVHELLERKEAVRPHLQTDFKKNKFTIVMPSYKRTETLKEIFDHYCPMEDIIDQILIVWNNVGESVPTYLVEYPCKFPITFLEQKKNTLNNRFVPYPEIKTECELNNTVFVLIFFCFQLHPSSVH